MIRFILYVAILLVTVWAGAMLAQDPGYALFAYKSWSIEMPIWFMAVLVFLLSLLVFIFVRLSYGTRNFMYGMRKRSLQRRARRTHLRTIRGLIELAEGNWERAEYYLTRAARRSETRLINYLAAARAAQEQGAYDRRDNHLRKAHETTTGAEVAVGLTQAKLQMDHQQLEQSLATLCHLRELVPNHSYVLKLLHKVYGALKDWDSLHALLPTLRKRKILKPEQLAQLELEVFQHRLQEAAQKTDSAIIEKIWQSAPKSAQRDPKLLGVYVDYLLTHQLQDEAEQLLREVLKKHWHVACVNWYGTVKASDPNKQLKVAEGWLKQHAKSPVLLLCLGRLARRCQLWGKARNYLESALAIDEQSIALYAELACVLEALGEPDMAQKHYKRGLMLAADARPDLKSSES